MSSRRSVKRVLKLLSIPLILLLFITLLQVPAKASTITSDPQNDAELHSLGAIPDPPELIREKAAPYVQARAALPSFVDMTQDFPYPGDQGSQGSCTAWAVGYAMKSYEEKIEHNWNINQTTHQFSPAYIYNQLNGGTGSGIAISSACQLVVDQGVCTLNTMPYNDSNFTLQPTSVQKSEALNYIALDYHTIDAFSANPNEVNQIKERLAARQPVVLFIYVYNDFDNLNSTNPIYDSIPSPPGSPRGYHAICLIGYDDSKGAFKFVNSWGENWGIDGGNGHRGYGWISYNLLSRSDLYMPGYYLCDNQTLTLNTTELNLRIGQSSTLQATPNPNVIAAPSNHSITWSSNTPAIATVDNSGKVTAKSGGTATITATYISNDGNRNSASCTVRIPKDVDVLVNRFYTNCLGREGDAAGIADWSNRLLNHQITAAGLVEGFFFGGEYAARNTSNSLFLDHAYKTILNRNPDSNGKTYYLNLLNNGVTRRYVLSCLVESAEFGNECNKCGISQGAISLSDPMDKNINYTQFVFHFYKTCFNRTASASEMNYYVDQIAKGQLTGARMANNFLSSSEFTNKHYSNDQYITILYNMLFNRNADSGGRQYWNNLLNNGTSRYDMLKIFVTNTEFKNLCSKYNVPQGTL